MSNWKARVLVVSGVVVVIGALWALALSWPGNESVKAGGKQRDLEEVYKVGLGSKDLSIVRDTVTGCEYLIGTGNGTIAITPRMKLDGHAQVCEK